MAPATTAPVVIKMLLILPQSVILIPSYILPPKMKYILKLNYKTQVTTNHEIFQ